jgi:hypothetical protein
MQPRIFGMSSDELSFPSLRSLHVRISEQGWVFPRFKSYIQGHFIMHRVSFGRTTALAGMAALTLAGSPVLAGVEVVTQVTTAGRSAKTCTNLTNSIQQLVMIDKIGDDDFQCLGVTLEGGAIKTLHLETHSFVSTGLQPDQERIKIEDFSPAVIESSRGAVLDGIPGHDAIVLRGYFSNPPGRVELLASFLYNGFTNEYHSCRIELDQAPDRDWHMVNRFDQIVSHIVVQTRRIPLIGDFGIANLEGACT